MEQCPLFFFPPLSGGSECEILPSFFGRVENSISFENSPQIFPKFVNKKQDKLQKNSSFFLVHRQVQTNKNKKTNSIKFFKPI